MNQLKELKLILEENIIKNENIDIIYKDIINYLIVKDYLSNYNYSNEIMAQMDIENIDITKTIYDGLYIILDMKNSYISNYKISDIKV